MQLDDLKQLSLDGIKKGLKSLSYKIDDSNKTKATLNLTPTNKERSDIMTLINELNSEFDINPEFQKLNEFRLFQNLKGDYQQLLKPKDTSEESQKHVRFDVAEEDSHLDDIHIKLKMNKNRILNEIQPELAYHDNVLNDLEQGMDTGILHLNTINNDSILPKWRKSGYSRTAEFKRTVMIAFLFILLIVLWVL